MADILVLICIVLMFIDIIANIILAVDVLRLIEVSSLDLSKNEDNGAMKTAVKALLPSGEPVRHGRWEQGGYACGETEWICSECGFSEWRTSNARMKFCMNCGARMDGKQDV